MTEQKFDDRLLKILEQEVLKEQWKKKVKVIGIVTKKRISKKESLVFTVKTRNSEHDIVVPQHRKEEFEIAAKINEGDVVKAIGDRQVSGIIFCDRIKRITQEEKKIIEGRAK